MWGSSYIVGTSVVWVTSWTWSRGAMVAQQENVGAWGEGEESGGGVGGTFGVSKREADVDEGECACECADEREHVWV